jgi:hypothetical protein
MQRKLVELVCLAFTAAALAGGSFAAEGDPKLVALGATSQGPGSKDLSCLLTKACTGYWTPIATDHGLNEGIYLQFESPQDLTKVEVIADGPINISVNGDRLNSAALKEGTASKAWSVGWSEAIAVKSVFVSVSETDAVSTPLKIYSIAFFGKGGAAQRLNVVAPLTVKATVQASSILEPTTAYQPANLFDSRYDFAWSTYGKKTNGIGEWVKVAFDSPQDIDSIIFWNGYQRSDSHYKANGRIQSMVLTDKKGQSQELALKDEMGPQAITLEKSLREAASIELKIAKTYPGSKYPDVLLSEVRFVDPKGNIISPRVPLEVPKPSDTLKRWLDKSMSSTICGIVGDGMSIANLDFRLRSDGSFAVYKTTQERAEQASDADDVKDQVIWEGNWEELDSKVRIFGKRYSTRVDYEQMAYGLAERRSTTEIFQTDVKIVPFKSLSPAEKDEFIARLIKAHQIENASRLIVRKMSPGVDTAVNVTAGTAKQVLLNLLESSDATVIDSPLFSDAFVPSDSGFCLRRW